MAILTDLAVELLQMIANAEVKSGTILRQKDLASLCLVNRWLHEVINRILYVHGMKYKDDATFFNHAVKHGNLDTLKVAVSLCIEPESWHRLLVVACTNRHRNIVTWLLDRGTPLEETPERILNSWYYGFYVGDFAESQPRGERLMIEGCPALLISINNQMEDIAILLLSYGASPSFIVGERRNFRSVLHYAACRGMVQVVEYLLQKLEMSVDLKDYKGYTPLHYAIKYAQDENTEMLKTLIRFGADVNNEVGGEIPLTSALFLWQFQHANILLDAGSKIKPDNPQLDVMFPIHTLMHTNLKRKAFRNSIQWSILRRLVDAGADLTERYIGGCDPLEEAIIYGGPEMVSCILAMKADKHGEESLKQVYIFDFMTKNYEDIDSFVKKVEILLNGGIRVDTPLSDGHSFLSWIFHNGHAPQMQRMVNMAIESMLDRSHLDDILKELITDPVYLEYTAELEDLKMLMSSGAKLYTTKDIGLAVSCCLPHERLVRIGWLTMILDMGYPTRKIPSLVTSALKRRVGSGAVEYLLDLVKPRIWQQNPQWLHDAVKADYYAIV